MSPVAKSATIIVDHGKRIITTEESAHLEQLFTLLEAVSSYPKKFVRLFGAPVATMCDQIYRIMQGGSLVIEISPITEHPSLVELIEDKQLFDDTEGHIVELYDAASGEHQHPLALFFLEQQAMLTEFEFTPGADSTPDETGETDATDTTDKEDSTYSIEDPPELWPD